MSQIERYQYLESNTIEEEKNSLRDILNVLFRHKRKIVVFFLAVVLTAGVFTFLMPKTYQSDARVLLKVGRESVGVDPTVMGPTVNISESRESEINSELLILKSRTIIEKVVDQLGPERFLVDAGDADAMAKLKDSTVPPRELAIKKLSRALKVDAENRSHVINLSFQAGSPEIAQLGLSSVIDAFLEHHIRVHRTQASPQFFEEQSQAILESLHQKERELERFRVENNVSSADKQKDALLTLINQLERDADDTKSQISSSQARIASFESSLKGRSEVRELSRIDGRASVASDSMRSRLNELKLKEAELRARHRDTSPALIQIRDQIAKAEVAMRGERSSQTEVTLGIDANYQAIKLSLDQERAHLVASQAKLKGLDKDISARHEEMARLSSLEVTEKQLQREVEALHAEFLRYSENLQRAKISNAFDKDKVSNVSIVQSPTRPIEAVKPNKILNMALALVLGLFGGLGMAFFIEFFDNTLRSNEDVEKRLGLPVLVAVSSEEFETCI